jgi:hypothetical protein
VISIPNSQVLNAVVGPLPDPSACNTPQPTPPLMAQPAGQPPSASPLIAHGNVQTTPQPASEHDSQADSQPEVPPGTPEPRPAGTPT